MQDYVNCDEEMVGRIKGITNDVTGQVLFSCVCMFEREYTHAHAHTHMWIWECMWAYVWSSKDNFVETDLKKKNLQTLQHSLRNYLKYKDSGHVHLHARRGIR